MHDVATEQSPTDPPVESPRFTVAPAVAALPDDQAQAVWEQSEYVVSWGTQEGHEIVWLQRDGKLPLVSWSAEEALDTLNFIPSLDYSALAHLAFPCARTSRRTTLWHSCSDAAVGSVHTRAARYLERGRVAKP